MAQQSNLPDKPALAFGSTPDVLRTRGLLGPYLLLFRNRCELFRNP